MFLNFTKKFQVSMIPIFITLVYTNNHTKKVNLLNNVVVVIVLKHIQNIKHKKAEKQTH